MSWYISDNGQGKNFYAQSTGVTSGSSVGNPDYDLMNIGRHKVFRRTSSFFTRDELFSSSGWRLCEGGDEYIESGCNVYLSTQSLSGLSTGQIRPFTHDDTVSLVDLLSSDLLRGLNLSYSSASAIHNLETLKYNVDQNYWANSNSNQNNAKYRISTNGYMQLTSAIGLPLGGVNADFSIAESALGILLDGSYNSFDEEATTWEIQYEPIVGIPAKLHGHQPLVFRCSTDYLSSGLYSDLFSSNQADVLLVPLFWGIVDWEMEKVDADILAGILYGLPQMASTMLLIFVLLGVLLMIVGMALCFKSRSSTISPSK